MSSSPKNPTSISASTSLIAAALEDMELDESLRSEILTNLTSVLTRPTSLLHGLGSKASLPGEPQAPHTLASTSNTRTIIGDTPALIEENKAPPPPIDATLPRYVPKDLLGVGGMSEVWRAWDNLLDRPVALKILSNDRSGDPRSLYRFAEEATTTAGLQHPGITPIYDVGTVADGRPFIAMKEIKGRTLSQVIREAHDQALSGGRSLSTWRLVEIFQRVCTAMAYAHGEGIVHRDLKPENIMVGSYGEVLVVDWGIARQELGREGRSDEKGIGGHLAKALTQGLTLDTIPSDDDVLVGTPSYMPPEVIQEEVTSPNPRGDVYALGAILYELLCGSPPHTGATAIQIFISTIRNEPPPLPEGIPGELRRICARSLSKEATSRYPSALELAEDIQGWLEQAKLRQQALEILAGAEVYNPKRDHRAPRERARGLRQKAKALLRPIRPNAPIDHKRPAWALEEEADRLERMAEIADVHYIQALRSALSLVPDLPEAQERLSDYYHQKHREAEQRRDLGAAARYEILLRDHDQGRYQAYLKGEGSLSLVTYPAGAKAMLYRFETHERRLVPVFSKPLGTTPLTAQALPQGSYLIQLEKAGYEKVLYPVEISRGEHWTGWHGSELPKVPVVLPKLGVLDRNDVYIPPGPFWCGGDVSAPGSLPRARVNLKGFVIRRFPVTNREYLNFLNDLVDRGEPEEAERWVPRGASPHPNELGEAVYGQDFEGYYFLDVDGDGDRWEPDWPVMLVDWFAARAYARWEAQRSGEPWRLVRDLEWEKAARGVDGRAFPWGDYLDPTWCCIRESHSARPMLVAVDTYPDDISLYGVRGMAGNVRDWCEDRYERAEKQEVTPPDDDLLPPSVEIVDGEDPSPRVNRGGFFNVTESGSRCATRDSVLPDSRGVITGFRLARPLKAP